MLMKHTKIMKKMIISGLILITVIYISFGVYLTVSQERFMYNPSPQDFESCEKFTEAEKINHLGTRMYVKLYDNRPTVVMYHGNAGSACDRYFYADLLTEANYGYIIVEYAGFSNDTQRPTHKLLKRDVENVISYLKEKDISDVFIIGRSIGTGVATYHTLLAQPNKLLLISPFTNLSDTAGIQYWYYPTSILVDNAFDNVENLKNYSGKVTIIHGTADKIIPYKLAEDLFQSLSGEKDIVPIDGGNHHNLFTFNETHEAINKFLTETY